jgi:hypothetical protein
MGERIEGFGAIERDLAKSTLPGKENILIAAIHEQKSWTACDDHGDVLL